MLAVLPILKFLLTFLCNLTLYEAHLRIHQCSALVLAFGIVQHLLSISDFDIRPVYAYGGLIFVLNLFHILRTAYRNKTLGQPWSSATFYREQNSIRAIIHLPRELHVHPGQYINIWIPSIELFSSHPFVVAQSWRAKADHKLELLIQRRNGITSRLWRALDRGQRSNRSVLLSGPHGPRMLPCTYDTIIMVASSFGITPMFLYLEEFTKHGCGHQICLVWERHASGKQCAFADHQKLTP